MADLPEKPESKHAYETRVNAIKSLFPELAPFLDEKKVQADYDTSRIAEFTAFMAQPAINWEEEKNSDLLDDLQANILKHHKKKNSEYWFITFREGSAQTVKAWLATFAKQLTTAKDQLLNMPGKSETILNVYLTYSGYQFLNIPESVIPSGLAFRSDMYSRLRLPRDVQPKDADEQDIHAIIHYAFNEDPDPNGQLLIQFGAEMAELNPLHKVLQRGTLKNPLPPDYEFEEGIGNPRFFPGAALSQNLIPMQASDISPLNVVLAKDAGGNKALSYGSYGAFLKLQMNVKAIRALEKVIIANINGYTKAEKKRLAIALVIGRFSNGTPLTLSDKTIDHLVTNNFNYTEMVRLSKEQGIQDDSTGMRCPFHAHIRKANPRTPETKDIRIVRRGVFYQDKKGSGLGLLFLSFQRSLENQFEYILNNWMLNRFTHGTDKAGEPISICSGTDMLFSRANDQYEMPARWNNLKVDGSNPVITVPEQMVRFQQGLYFFAPSISFFTKLKLVPPPPLPNARERDISEPSLLLSEKPETGFNHGTERHFRMPKTVNPKFRRGTEVLWDLIDP